VLKELEGLRTAGGIGSSLQAEVELHCQRREVRRWLASLGDDLKFVLITSAATLRRAADGAEPIVVTPSTQGREVRALLALSRGRRARRRASGDLRPLLIEPARCGRGASPCLR
jgi:hypothetical protein